MDSPLLPDLRRPGANAPDSPDTMLADLSMSDDLLDNSFGASPLPPTSSNSRHVGFAAPSRDQSRVSQPDMMLGGGGKSNANKPRFSLFAAPRQTPSSSQNGIRTNGHDDDGDDEDQGEGDETLDAIQPREGDDETIHVNAGTRAQTSAERDDKLRESLYELRKMNEVFEGFLGALEAAKAHNERLSTRVHQTSELLDRYTAILGQSEHTARLINNPNWTGADDDLAAVEAEEAARQAALDAEEQRRRLVHEKAAADARRKSEVDNAKSGVNGRGGAASRGRGAATRGAPTRGRGSGIPYAPTRAVSGPKPPSASNGNPTGLKKTTTTTASGLGGKYGHVQSSGYGPGAKR